jgi:hypothetical protein
VQIVTEGHFAVSYLEGGPLGEDGLHIPLQFVIDVNNVFGWDTTLTEPTEFFSPSVSLDDIISAPQCTFSKTPSAFAATHLSIPPKSSASIVTVFGHAKDLESFVNVMSPRIRTPGFVDKKRKESIKVTSEIVDKVATHTSSPVFDAYVKQDFLDNVLRGGMPVPLGSKEDPKILHTYSRIHGDIERDYNNFQIDATFYSQGPGNFRDVSQNRRLDVLHTPEVYDFNVRMFLSLIQADGYNPLTVAGTNFIVSKKQISSLIEKLQSIGLHDDDAPKLQKLLLKPFRVGKLFKDMQDAGIKIEDDKREEFIEDIMKSSEQHSAAQFAQNGYWSDHWTYTMDLIDNFVSVYPDHEEKLMWSEEHVPFFMSPAFVLPRSERFALKEVNADGSAEDPSAGNESMTYKTIRAVKFVSMSGDMEYPAGRAKELEKVEKDSIADESGAGALWQRARDGSVFGVTPIAKLLMLAILKFATLDPQGMGVEMEGGKPGWNDAMNGLPGILGSGMPETYEMLRILRYVRHVVQVYDRNVFFPVEFATLINEIMVALDNYAKATEHGAGALQYWEETNAAREKYRMAVAVTFDGLVVKVTHNTLIGFMASIEEKTVDGIERALKTMPSGLSPTYFHYECTDFDFEVDNHTRIGPFPGPQPTPPVVPEFPTASPATVTPTGEPSHEPTSTSMATRHPTIEITTHPTDEQPSEFPTEFPSTDTPTTRRPTDSLTDYPTEAPSEFPSPSPGFPTRQPVAEYPSDYPSEDPTEYATKQPTKHETADPTVHSDAVAQEHLDARLSPHAARELLAKPILKPKAFETKTLPLFLEGPTRYFKSLRYKSSKREIYDLTRSSPMYDVKLKMLQICESLAGMTQDIGRMMAFSPGWLENQSIWLHMSYKFYLELIRGGLYDEFFAEIKTGLVPFMNSTVYGRSPIEASSFIVSSAFPDAKLHGEQ